MSVILPIADMVESESHVRFGSTADVKLRNNDVRFTPESGLRSGLGLTATLVSLCWRGLICRRGRGIRARFRRC
jgi:hypothetical protein